MTAKKKTTIKDIEKEYRFGLDTFGDLPLRTDGTKMSYAESIRQVIKEAKMMDKGGLDLLALGEHHRPDYAISSPDMVLAAIASVTKHLTLSSGVTVLSSDDPVRVFERFSTLDAVSDGRAKVILGRGSFTESFPLFGYDLRNYDILFEEKINLFHKLLDEKPVTWSGQTRAALEDADVFPKTESGRLNVAVGVGGSPDSIIRAARYDFPVILAIIGGNPARFRPYVELYRQAVEQLGGTEHPIGFHSPGFVADTDEEAMKLHFKPYKEQMDRIGKSRGWPPMSYEQYKQEIEHGSLYVGSPETVAQKIFKNLTLLDARSFEMVYGHGQLPVETREHMVNLYVNKVIPRVKELLAKAANGNK